jgi:hypothetical protein
MLAGTDHEITEAKDGEHAPAAVARERPDLILMEIQLPSMDGTRQCGESEPILRSYQSRSSQSAPTHRVRSNRRHERLAATTLCPSRTVPTNYWLKFAITCNSSWRRLLQCMSPLLARLRHPATARQIPLVVAKGKCRG